MRKIALMTLLAVSTAMGCATAVSDGAVSDGPKYLYLTGTGPYRGRVIDVKTKAPIRDVIVVAVWYYHINFFNVHGIRKFHDAIEVVTDSQGYFVVDAPNIERRAPAMTDFPVFTFFKPGYRYFQGWFASEEDIVQRQNKPLLGIVELESISDLSRREQGGKLPPDLSIDIPREKIPMFLKAYLEHVERLSR
jgi:hypothetical protein